MFSDSISGANVKLRIRTMFAVVCARLLSTVATLFSSGVCERRSFQNEVQFVYIINVNEIIINLLRL